MLSFIDISKSSYMQKYSALGVMSGTSLDGLDLAFCEFWYNRQWNFKIIAAETISYTKDWRNKLTKASKLNGLELSLLNKSFGELIGRKAINFLNTRNLQADFIASHGHTIFHQPENNFTLQIGCGAAISATSGIKTVVDFRSLDVMLGGQGAPLVPIGDQLLFNEYDYCINIGGFANISFQENNQRFAYDIGPANIILNYLANKLNLDYDKNGEIGKQGSVNQDLLTELNNLPYYKLNYPKSLGREWLENDFISIIEKHQDSIPNLLASVYEHIAIQISKSINNQTKKVLITGGGALNDYLINLIKHKTESEIIIPNKLIVDFKEALIFAFLGLLRNQGRINTLSSVTGAARDSSGGTIYIP